MKTRGTTDGTITTNRKDGMTITTGMTMPSTMAPTRSNKRLRRCAATGQVRWKIATMTSITSCRGCRWMPSLSLTSITATLSTDADARPTMRRWLMTMATMCTTTTDSSSTTRSSSASPGTLTRARATSTSSMTAAVTNIAQAGTAASV